MEEVSSAEHTETTSKISFGTCPLKAITDDRIASVTSNPFYKLDSRQSTRTSHSELPAFLKRSKNTVDTDYPRDYTPGVGHVHKLSDKFAALGVENQSSSSAFPKLKHASSEDNILNERDHDAGDGSHAFRVRAWASSLNHRAGSVESLSPRKSPHGPGVYPLSHRHVGKQWEPVSVPPKLQREVRVEAPDVNLARKDIILIENPPQPSSPPESDKLNETVIDTETPGLKSELDFARLPKQKSVSAVRSLFEQDSPHSFVSVTAVPNAEVGNDSEIPSVSSGDTVLCSGATPVLVLNTYPGIKNDLPKPVYTDIQVSVKDLSSSELPQKTRLSGDREGSKRWMMLDVKTAECDSDNSSRSSTPPPLPLSPPPTLPPSALPEMPTGVGAVDGEVVDVLSVVPGVAVDVDYDQRPLPSPTQSSETEDSTHPAPEHSDCVQQSLITQSTPPQSAQPQTVPPHPVPRLLKPPLPPLPPSILPPPISPRSVAAIKATHAYHPIPFRRGAGAFNSGTVVPPSFIPSIKKTSPVASVRQNRGEVGSTDSGLNCQSFTKVSFLQKRETEPSNDSCETIVESGGSGVIIKMEEKEELGSSNVVQMRRVESKQVVMIQKVSDKEKEEHDRIVLEEVDRKIDTSVNAHKETRKATEPMKKIPQRQLDEVNNTEHDSSTDKEPGHHQTIVSSEVDPEIWQPSIHSSQPDSVESLWRLALKPVSRHEEDSQAKPVAMAPTTPAFISSSQGPAQSESTSHVDVKTNAAHSVLLLTSAEVEKAEDAHMKSKETHSLTEGVIKENMLVQFRQSTQHTVAKQDAVVVMKSTESTVVTVSLPASRKQEVDTESKGSGTCASSAVSSISPAVSEKMDEADVKSEDSGSDTAIDSSLTEGAEEASKPVRGIPTIIANRLKQQNSQKQNGNAFQSRSPNELFGVRLNRMQPRPEPNSNTEDRAGSPLRTLSSTTDTFPSEPSSVTTEEVVNQFASVLKRKDHSIRNRHGGGGVSQIFDSSQLHKKRKEKKLAEGGSDVDARVGSSPGAGLVSPCNIEFIGANVSTGRSLLGKNRKVKISVQFHQAPAKTFEYPSEQDALQDYLSSHPNEVVLLQEVPSWPSESSSDHVDIRQLLRAGEGSGSLDALDKYLLKSNTSLAHAGSLQSYRGKYQQDYVLGSIHSQPDKPESPTKPQTHTAEVPNAMQVLPAQDNDLQTYSVDTSADLLF